MDKPKVSIIIPVYNGAGYLTQAIDSALGQTYQNREIIVVNDGSTDQGTTRRVALSYGKRIQYIEKENGGVASALNCGIRAMEGEYFTWLSHDDLFCANKLSMQMEQILSSGNPDVIALGNCSFFSQGRKSVSTTEFQKYYPIERLTKGVFLLLWGEVHFSTFLFSRHHFDRVGLFREDLATAQDNEFIFRLLRGATSVFTETPISRVRMHQHSGTNRWHNIVDQENRELYASIAKKVLPDEASDICGSWGTFLCKIAGIIKSMGGKSELFSLEELRKQALPRNMDFTAYEALQRRWSDIILFGAGQYGIRLKYELNARGIEPRYFLDNDSQKAGQVLDGICCYPVEYARQAGNSKIVVTQKNYGAACEQLHKMGIHEFTLKDEVEMELLNYEPCKI